MIKYPDPLNCFAFHESQINTRHQELLLRENHNTAYDYDNSINRVMIHADKYTSVMLTVLTQLTFWSVKFILF